MHILGTGTAALAGVFSFLMGLLCGVAPGVAVIYIIWRKNRKEVQSSPSQSISPASPYYDIVELPNTDKYSVPLQLRENVAYGHANI